MANKFYMHKNLILHLVMQNKHRQTGLDMQCVGAHKLMFAKRRFSTCCAYRVKLASYKSSIGTQGEVS